MRHGRGDAWPAPALANVTHRSFGGERANESPQLAETPRRMHADGPRGDAEHLADELVRPPPPIPKVHDQPLLRWQMVEKHPTPFPQLDFIPSPWRRRWRYRRVYRFLETDRLVPRAPLGIRAKRPQQVAEHRPDFRCGPQLGFDLDRERPEVCDQFLDLPGVDLTTANVCTNARPEALNRLAPESGSLPACGSVRLRVEHGPPLPPGSGASVRDRFGPGPKLLYPGFQLAANATARPPRVARAWAQRASAGLTFFASGSVSGCHRTGPGSLKSGPVGVPF